MKTFIAKIILIIISLLIAVELVYWIFIKPISGIFKKELVTFINILTTILFYVILALAMYGLIKLIEWALDQI